MSQLHAAGKSLHLNFKGTICHFRYLSTSFNNDRIVSYNVMVHTHAATRANQKTFGNNKLNCFINNFVGDISNSK